LIENQREARINVKLVSDWWNDRCWSCKSKSDVILISGFDGGTGAAPNFLTTYRYSVELGLAEAQQTLILNDLRSRVVLECDGQLKQAVTLLLGAEEFGFATAPLVSGCIMMRACHLNTCPVGIATQDPELKKLQRNSEHIINFMYLPKNCEKSWLVLEH
jgi:glutamate synthase (ferredoxin)